MGIEEEFLESEVVFCDDDNTDHYLQVEETASIKEGDDHFFSYDGSGSDIDDNYLDWDTTNNSIGIGIGINRKKKRKGKMIIKQQEHLNTRSVPVDIPINKCSFDDCSDFDQDHDEDIVVVVDGTSTKLCSGAGGGCGGTAIVVPPHLIVARRIAVKMASSVFAHSGKPLKGRNLCQLRTSILRMTGFLET